MFADFYCVLKVVFCLEKYPLVVLLDCRACSGLFSPPLRKWLWEVLVVLWGTNGTQIDGSLTKPCPHEQPSDIQIRVMSVSCHPLQCSFWKDAPSLLGSRACSRFFFFRKTGPYQNLGTGSWYQVRVIFQICHVFSCQYVLSQQVLCLRLGQRLEAQDTVKHSTL